ncbi:chondroitinase family polysaccharide lyase [Carboxylicivirga sp. M1479]|uniref:chondroitinase family polysaccharide lyase n=1 Tax=Carboxylicivirga sp. M1479 TaxID=2594476 RepID=UPI00163DBDB1|nr:chondroitinase family polysaccharide lyase [Carboxylicivirga sp. M1479]
MWKLQYIYFGLFFSFITNSIFAQSFEETDTFDNCETFENGLPSNWQTEDGGAIEITNERYKQGQYSLKWNWQTNSKIIVSDKQLSEVSYEKGAGMHVWIYSDVNINDEIQFCFYDATDNKRCEFTYKINFTGWRGLWVRFWEDIAISSRTPLVKMEIISPTQTSNSSIYFDIVEFKSSISYKRSPSYQYAHPYQSEMDEEVKDEWASWIYEQRYPNPTLPLPNDVPNKTQQTFSDINARFENWLLGTNKYASNEQMLKRLAARNSYINSGVNRFNELDIYKAPNGQIFGPALFTNKSSHGPKFGRDIGEKLCLQLALDYRINHNQSSKEKLLLLLDYMHDQGWAKGSAMETTDHQKLRTAAWAYSVYLLKDDLKNIEWKNGASILDREMDTLHWLTYFNIIFAPLDDRLEVSVDDFRSATIMRLMYILMMENDDPAKVQYMNHYTQWLNGNLQPFEGWTGGIKADGMGYHHRGPYMNAYSNNGVHVMSQVLYFLRHTEFDANNDAKQTVKNYLLNYSNITGFYDVPKGISGRISGLDKAARMVTAFAYMAQCMQNGVIDEELASITMRYWQPQHQPINEIINSASLNISYFNTPGEIEAILDIVEIGQTKAENPQGLWMKPYAAMAVFRGNDWYVSIKGTSAYVWDFESGSNENTYGRYDGYGQMETINNTSPHPSMVYSGHDYNNGWDWCRVPGTTSVNLGLDGLKTSLQRVFTPNTFVGGVQQQNKAGVWAMEYQDVHYSTSLSFKKSIFFFQPDMMVCLGSNISAMQPQKLESTLLQNVISSSNYNHAINGEEVNELDYSYLPINGAATIIDDQGKGFYIPDDSNLNITYNNNDSETMRRQESNGDVLTAWFKHDNKNNYEYAIFMKTTQSQLNSFINNPTYEIIQHNNSAHIVKHTEQKQTGYALFEPNQITNDDFINSSSLPAMLMVTDEATDTKIISLCNPDFNRRKLNDIGDIKKFDDLFGPFQSQTLELKINGAWSADEFPTNVRIISKNATSTVIEVETHDAKTYDFILKMDSVNSTFPNADEQHRVWPNPTSNKLNFSMAEKAILYSIEGRQLIYATNTSSFDIGNLNDGIYILECVNAGKVFRTKILKHTAN